MQEPKSGWEKLESCIECAERTMVKLALLVLKALLLYMLLSHELEIILG